MTHREQINQYLLGLSDEDLSYLLSNGFYCFGEKCPVYNKTIKKLSDCMIDKSCHESWLEWLKKG